MDLLKKIQEEVVESGIALAPILLKLRLLASRLENAELENWVRYETEGYPEGIPVPEYRKVPVHYVGTWSGPGWIRFTAPIPPVTVEKYAGKGWTKRETRQSIAVIDDMLLNSNDGVIQIDSSNLIFLFQGEVYPDYDCHSVMGSVSCTSLQELQNVVRHRILQLTIEIGKVIPDDASGQSVRFESNTTKSVTNIVNQIFHGDYTSVHGIGENAQVTLNIAKGDTQAMIGELVNVGIPEEDAQEFAEVVASEKPESSDDPIGRRANEWLQKNVKKALNGTWKIGREVAVRVLVDAASKFYG